MKQVFYANQLIKRLKQLGYESFVFNDLVPEELNIQGLTLNPSVLVAAKWNGLVKMGEYNSTTKVQRWIIIDKKSKNNAHNR